MRDKLIITKKISLIPVEYIYVLVLLDFCLIFIYLNLPMFCEENIGIFLRRLAKILGSHLPFPSLLAGGDPAPFVRVAFSFPVIYCLTVFFCLIMEFITFLALTIMCFRMDMMELVATLRVVGLIQAAAAGSFLIR